MKKFLCILFIINLSRAQGSAISPVTVVIGSANTIKVSAVAEVMPLFDFLVQAQLISKAVPSGISEQPLSLQETIHGAQNRARAAAVFGTIGIGVENGLCNIPGTNRYVDIAICCVYANNRYAFGFSQGYEIPQAVLTYVFDQKLDIGQAMHAASLTADMQIGGHEGAISILTKGRITRKDSIKQALIIALAQLEQINLFE